MNNKAIIVVTAFVTFLIGTHSLALVKDSKCTQKHEWVIAQNSESFSSHLQIIKDGNEIREIIFHPKLIAQQYGVKVDRFFVDGRTDTIKITVKK